MANRKIACTICGKKFHPKGLYGHMRKHDRAQFKTNADINRISEHQLGYKEGYQAGQDEQRRRTGDARIALVESVAKLNQALAGVLDEFRQG